MKRSPKLTDTAIRIATDRYFTEKEKEQSPEIAFKQAATRIASAVSLAERTDNLQNKWAKRFYDLIVAQKLVPAGRFWANSGMPNQQFPNCFVFPITDTKVNGKDGIFDTLSIAIVTASGGGGTGFDWSRLRSRGVPTSKSRGVATGPVSFLKSYDACMDNIQQGGSRRAANMGILRVDHPDILEFIFLKDRTQKYRRFNVSVGMTDAFMSQLENHPFAPWKVKDPHTKDYYRLFIPYEGDVLKIHTLLKENYLKRILLKDGEKAPPMQGIVVDTRMIWEAIVQNAWECGDPGLFFVDTVNAKNPLIKNKNDISNPYYVRAPNPCGEIPMEDNGICMLANLNLANFVEEDDAGNLFINFDELSEAVAFSVRFLDDALDVSDYPSEATKKQALSTRRIGLGVMGWADMLIMLRIRYGSDKSFELAEQVMSLINDVALETSESLGKEKGSFPAFKGSKYDVEAAGTYKDNDFPLMSHLRNAYRTTVPPTGTTSLLTGVNESIEPMFQFSYTRKDETGEHIVTNHLLTEYIKTLGEKRLQDTKLPDTVDALKLPDYFVTTMEVSGEQHVKMQAAFQKHVDNSISKTINLPQEATFTDVDKVYRLAYKLKCKGITIYRDGSKEIQVLNVKKDSPVENVKEKATHFVTREEGALSGLTWKVKTGDGTCYVTINKNSNHKPVEVFIRVGKAGSDINAYSEALGRMISLALQHEVFPNEIRDQLVGISGDKVIFHRIGDYKKVLSVPDAVGKVLEEFILEKDKISYDSNKEVLIDHFAIEKTDNTEKQTDEEICPKCHQKIIQVSRGCTSCGCGSACE